MLLTFSVILQANSADKSEDIVVEMLIPKLDASLHLLFHQKNKTPIVFCSFWYVFDSFGTLSVIVVWRLSFKEGRPTSSFVCLISRLNVLQFKYWNAGVKKLRGKGRQEWQEWKWLKSHLLSQRSRLLFARARCYSCEGVWQYEETAARL